MKTLAKKQAKRRRAPRAGTGRHKQAKAVPSAPRQNALANSNGFQPAEFLAKVGAGKVTVEFPKNSTIFSQGNSCESVFYIQKGRVKIGVVSEAGKEATVGVLNVGEFVGEDCIANSHPLRLVTAIAMTDCTLLKISKKEMVRVLAEDHSFSEVFVSFLLARNARIQEDLIDQLFNSSEKRLARVLLQLAQFGKEGQPEVVIPKISQESLAEMVGTTRSRVSFFMNRFRKLGFIEYDGAIKVHSSLLNVVLHD